MRVRFFAVLLGVVFSAVARAPSFTYLDLVRTINKSHSLEDLIPRLPKEIRSNFTFIYQSRGLFGDDGFHTVSPDFPKVLLFSDDAKLVLAFLGNPALAGNNLVAVMHFDDETSSFVFSQHLLPAGENPANAEVITLESATDLHGAKNPPSCLKCHGADPRPIFDSYPLWPGFYGSVRDTFPPGSKELPLYKSFLEGNAKMGVYQKLLWPKGSATPPYLDPSKFDIHAIEGHIEDLLDEPNTRLGMALTELNRKRLMRKFKASPKYASNRYSLLSGMLGCSSHLILPADELSKIKADVVAENASRQKRLGVGYVSPDEGGTDMQELEFVKNLGMMKTVAQILGLDFSDWSMAFEKGSYAFFDGILSSAYQGKSYYLLEDLIIEIMGDLEKTDSRLSDYYQVFPAYQDLGLPFGNRLYFPPAVEACKILPTG